MGMWEQYKRPLRLITGKPDPKPRKISKLRAELAEMADYLACFHSHPQQTAHMLICFDASDNGFHARTNFLGEEPFLLAMARALSRSFNRFAKNHEFHTRIYVEGEQ